MIWRELGLTWTDAWLTIVTATGVYAATILFGRLFGQRQFSQSSSHDLAFVFALGSIIGRVVLVRTSLAVAVLGLATMFGLHATAGLLHHRSRFVHRLLENRPVLLVADGEPQDDLMRRAHVSHNELHQQLRLQGYGSLEGLAAVILERSGSVSVVTADTTVDPEVFAEVVGADRLRFS